MLQNIVPVFKHIIQLVLVATKADGDFTWPGSNWANPQFIEHMSFYMFDWNNPLDMMANTSRPSVSEIGPFTYTYVTSWHKYRHTSEWVYFQTHGSQA